MKFKVLNNDIACNLAKSTFCVFDSFICGQWKFRKKMSSKKFDYLLRRRSKISINIQKVFGVLHSICVVLSPNKFCLVDVSNQA